MLPIIFTFLKSYWKSIAIGSIILLVVGGAYVKGRKDCAKQMDKEVIQELERRNDSVERERGKVEQVREKIRANRELTPVDDKRDSCILSGDPFKERCVK